MSDKQKFEVGDVVVLPSHPENQMTVTKVRDDGIIVVALINKKGLYETQVIRMPDSLIKLNNPS
ncbi:MAG: hypothetical protein OXE42_11160 [Gammaproteobacteria bacterium]|nr:hypothetical protein [Gammaproteobacteria bacterium]